MSFLMVRVLLTVYLAVILYIAGNVASEAIFSTRHRLWPLLKKLLLSPLWPLMVFSPAGRVYLFKHYKGV